MIGTALPTPPAPRTLVCGLVAVAVVEPGVPPYQYRLQRPDSGGVLNGSVEVFAIEIPVSNPDWPATRNAVVTYGNNSAVLQDTMLRNGTPLGMDSSANRGMVKVLEALPALLVVKVTPAPPGVGA